MKKTAFVSILLCILLAFYGCGTADVPKAPSTPDIPENAVNIVLSDSGVTVNGTPASSEGAVYTANDIVYYEEGKDFTYGEGSDADAHSKTEADAHTVVYITKAGTYAVSGKLSRGQIAIDLGKDAKEDSTAVVTLILNGADVTCTVAPAVIFYNVYECGSTEENDARRDVDTSAAGANVIIADGSVNNINGSYVARIYKPESVVMNDAGTEVEDAKKLHKYDGAFYSRMSMNVGGGKENSGILNIKAENEGLDSELHLTVNGANINIVSGNDGINTNEDGISVTTVNGGTLKIRVSGETGEGDGIDSNGWLVINGGTVIAEACSFSGDAGIDSDMGIHINGGTVIATGSMLDKIEEGGTTYAVFTFASKQQGGKTVTFKNANGDSVLDYTPENAYSILVFASAELEAGTYTLYSDKTQLAGAPATFGGFGGMGGNGGVGGRPAGDPPAKPEGNPPEHPNGTPPERPEGNPPDMPQGNPPEIPDGEWNHGAFDPNNMFSAEIERSTDFVIKTGTNMFSAITAVK